AEALQVIDRSRAAEPGEGAAQRLGHAGMPPREALDVGLVDHAGRQRHRGRPVVAPGEGRIDRLALGHRPAIVAPVEAEVAAWMTDLVAEMRIAPAEGADDRPGVRIEQQLVRVEAVA